MSNGFRRKSRQILKKHPRERCMQSLGKSLYKYNIGDQTLIKIDSSVQKGMPHTRYSGKIGIITEERGRAYVVEMKEGNKLRKLIVRHEHLAPYPKI